nr:Gfo/Idh/MocA family oxidoreductase [Granulosicoccus sp.]
RARKFADQKNAPLAFGSYDELLSCDEIDAVYIPLPTSQHGEWTRKSVLAGKHVLCEKPISLKSKQIMPLVRARDKVGVVVSEAFMVTYHPQWLKVKSLIAKGAIGRLRRIDASFTYFNRDPDNMRNQPELGGGVLPDIGVYPIVCSRFVTDCEPESVTAMVEYDPEFNTDRYAHACVNFPDFELGFYISTQLANRQSMVFHGDKGFIELSAPFNSNLYEGDELYLHNQAHNETRVFRYTGVNQYRLQVEAFSQAVSGKKTQVFSLEDSIRNQKVIDAIYKAGSTGRRVKV